MNAEVQTAGEAIALHSELAGVRELVAPCIAPLPAPQPASLSIRIESARGFDDTNGWEILTRSAVERDGDILVRDVCTAGFDMLARAEAGSAKFTFRRALRSRSRVVNAALPLRTRLLVRSALVIYPAMWRAATRGRAPLHAAAVRAAGENLLLIGAGGVGKSTLVDLETAAGGAAMSDNLCVSDGE